MIGRQNQKNGIRIGLHGFKSSECNSRSSIPCYWFYNDITMTIKLIKIALSQKAMIFIAHNDRITNTC